MIQTGNPWIGSQSADQVGEFLTNFYQSNKD